MNYLEQHIITIKNDQQSTSQDFILTSKTCSIGRHSQNDIVISNSLISRCHCTITPMLHNEEGQKISYWIIDGNLKGKRSANGIFFDKKKCLSHELKSDDVIYLGGIHSGIYILYQIIKFDQDDDLDNEIDTNISSNYIHKKNENDEKDQKDQKDQDEITVIRTEASSTTINQSIQEQEEKYRSVVRQVSQGIVLADFNSKQIIEANIAFCNLVGYTESELIQLKIYELQIIDVEVFNSHIQQIEEKKLNLISDATLLHKDGSAIEVELNISIIYLSQTSLICYTVRDIRQIKKFQRQLSQSLEEKQLLLREIHHRVKNNLLVVSGILDWQCEFTDNDRILQFMAETQKRIQAIALVHEKLYDSEDFSHIDIAQYIENLVEKLYCSFLDSAKKININFKLESVIFNIETITPCGLIVNELISNALKHAFVDRSEGSIAISLQKKDEKYLLMVKDDGVGFPETWELDKSDTLGLHLVSLLTSQLDGELRITQDQGSIIQVIFQGQEYKRRY